MQKWIGFRTADSNANLWQLPRTSQQKFLQISAIVHQFSTNNNIAEWIPKLWVETPARFCHLPMPVWSWDKFAQAHVNHGMTLASFLMSISLSWMTQHQSDCNLKKKKTFFPCSYCKAWTYYVVFFKIFQVDILPVYLSVFHAMFSPWALDPKLMQLGFLKVWMPFFIDSSCW